MISGVSGDGVMPQHASNGDRRLWVMAVEVGGLPPTHPGKRCGPDPTSDWQETLNQRAPLTTVKSAF